MFIKILVIQLLASHVIKFPHLNLFLEIHKESHANIVYNLFKVAIIVHGAYGSMLRN